jgi:hypothetical protein
MRPPCLSVYYVECEQGKILRDLKTDMGVEGAVRGLEGTHPADTCILTELE